MKTIFFRAALAAGILLCAGTACTVEELVRERAEALDKDFLGAPAYEEMETLELDWRGALELALAENLELRRAKNEIETAENNARRVWLNLVPLVNLGYFYNTALFGNGGDYYSEEYNYNLNIIFNIPALTRLPVDHYAAQLALFRAEKNFELKKREIVSKLYKLAKEIELSGRAFRFETENSPRERLAELEKRRKEETRAQWIALAALLGDVSKKYRLAGTLPDAPGTEILAERARRIDPLAATLMATELEASRLAQLGLKLNYWPTVTVNFYSPTLFSYSGGNQQGFNGSEKDVRMQLDLFVQLDTQLSTYYALKEAKANHELLEATLRIQMIERREKIAQVVRALEDFGRWKRAAEKYDAFLNRQGATSAEGALERRKASAAFRRDMFSQERENIEREAAMILEFGFLVPEEDAGKNGESGIRAQG